MFVCTMDMCASFFKCVTCYIKTHFATYVIVIYHLWICLTVTVHMYKDSNNCSIWTYVLECNINRQLITNKSRTFLQILVLQKDVTHTNNTIFSTTNEHSTVDITHTTLSFLRKPLCTMSVTKHTPNVIINNYNYFIPTDLPFII